MYDNRYSDYGGKDFSTMTKKPLVILTGPTAVGKTDLSIQLAKKINGEIISADSMQIYKKMDIGTAKVTKAEMKGVPHYLIDELMPDEEFNVTIWKERAKEALESIYAKGKIPIIAGGTGFYIQALLYDVDFTSDNNDYSYRKELHNLAEEKGADELHKMLQEVDPESAGKIHANNVKRVIRALEYHHLTGEKISLHNREQNEKKSNYNFVYFVLTMDRERLYERINRRVDIMLEQGLVDEVKALKEEGYHKDMVSMQGIGYKEILDYLDGEYDYERAVYLLKQDTRHFAKRQMTWFRREKDVTMLNKDKFSSDEDLLDDMLKILKERNILDE